MRNLRFLRWLDGDDDLDKDDDVGLGAAGVLGSRLNLFVISSDNPGISDHTDGTSAVEDPDPEEDPLLLPTNRLNKLPFFLDFFSAAA